MFKKIFFIVLGILVFVVVMLCAFVRLRHINVCVLKQDYNNLAFINEDNTFNINLYVSLKDTYITNKDEIENIHIENGDNYLEVLLKDISVLDESKIQKKNYYLYCFKFVLKNRLTCDLVCNDAHLCINYKEKGDIDLEVGDISFYLRKRIDEKDQISLSRAKGIVNEIDGKNRLCAIAIGLTSKKLVTITNIELLSTNVTINGVKQIEYDSVSKDYELTNYSFYGHRPALFNIELNGHEELLLTLASSSNFDINSFGLKITYMIDEKEYEYYTDKYCFYQSNNIAIEDDRIEIYEYAYY